MSVPDSWLGGLISEGGCWHPQLLPEWGGGRSWPGWGGWGCWVEGISGWVVTGCPLLHTWGVRPSAGSPHSFLRNEDFLAARKMEIMSESKGCQAEELLPGKPPTTP